MSPRFALWIMSLTLFLQTRVLMLMNFFFNNPLHWTTLASSGASMSLHTSMSLSDCCFSGPLTASVYVDATSPMQLLHMSAHPYPSGCPFSVAFSSQSLSLLNLVARLLFLSAYFHLQHRSISRHCFFPIVPQPEYKSLTSQPSIYARVTHRGTVVSRYDLRVNFEFGQQPFSGQPQNGQ